MFQTGLNFGVPAAAEDEILWIPPDSPPVLSNVPILSLDTETDGKNPFVNKPVGISIAYPTEGNQLQKYYLPFGHSEGNMDPDLIRRWGQYELRGKKLVGANIKFDIHMLRGWGLDLEAIGCEPYDVQFNAALLDDSPHVKVDLDTLGQQYAGLGKVDFPGDKNRMAEYPSWMVGAYAERDAEVTYRVHQATLPLIQRDGLDRVHALENSIIYAVCEIERNGCRINVEKLQLWRQEIRQMLQQVILELYNMTGMMIEPDSPRSMESLFHLLRIDPPAFQRKKGRKKKGETEEPTESKGKRKYTEEELLSLNHPVLNKVVQARWLTSLLSKFFDKYAKGLTGDILRSQFHQLKTTSDDDDESGTVSGRFSSSGGKDLSSGYAFNAQQVIGTFKQISTIGDHHIVRELFIPDEGMEYWSADMSQIEYRIATHFANAQNVIAAYQQKGADFHAITQALIQQYKPSHNNRTVTKNVNFAYVFGSGEDTLAATAGITKAEAGELLGIMRRNVPEFPKLLQNLAREAENRGYVTTLFGRRARFGTYEKRFYKALNSVVQGSAADIFKVYLGAIYRERHTLGITALRQVVHDEKNGDKQPGEHYTRRIEEFLNDQKVALKVPILWDLKTGANWKECH